MKRSLELKTQASKLIVDARHFLQKENRTADDEAKAKQMQNEAFEILERAKTEEAQEELEARTKETATFSPEQHNESEKRDKKADQWEEFRNFLDADDLGRNETRSVRFFSDKEKEEYRAYTSTTTNEGAEFMPETWVNEFGLLMRKLTPVGNLCRTIVIPDSDIVHMPKMTDQDIAVYGATDVQTGTLNATQNTSDVTFTPIALTAKFQLSKTAARRGSRTNLPSLLVQDLSRQMGYGLENGLCNGSGSSAPGGIFNTGGISTAQDVEAVLSLDGIKACKNKVGAEHWGNLSAVMHQNAFSDLEREVDSQNRPILTPDATQPGLFRIAGIPVFLSSKAPSTLLTGGYACVIGNFDYYVNVVSLGITLEVENSYSTNSFIWYARMEHDAKPYDATAFGRLKLTADASAS